MRVDDGELPIQDLGDEFDEPAFDEAVARLRRGELGEALIWLGRSHDELSDLHRLWERDRAEVRREALVQVADAASALELAA